MTIRGSASSGGEGPWLPSLIASVGIGGIVLSGRSEVTLQAAGNLAHPRDPLEGKGNVYAAAGSFYN